MKKLLSFVAAVLCAVGLSMASELQFSQAELLQASAEGGHYHAQFSPVNDYLLTSSENYTGLKLIELTSGAVRTLTTAKGAGFGVSIAEDGQNITYCRQELRQGLRYQQLERLSVKTGRATVLKKMSRGIISREDAKTQQVTVSIEDQIMVLRHNGQETLLAPNGEESYFSASISPDGTHIVYETAHHGTFVCRIDGTEVLSMGWLTAPVWMGNKWIVGMQSIWGEDNVKESRIVAKRIDGTGYQVVPTAEKIAMFPAASRDGRMLAFNNEKGQLFTVCVSEDNEPLTEVVEYEPVSTYVPTRKAVGVGPLAGIKIYLNPGHGGYDANDRSCWTIPVPETWSNPAGYWESKSNLVKGLALRDMLEDLGATIIMSRVENRSGVRDLDYYPNATAAEKELIRQGDDRDLGAIGLEANANQVDHFLSIHSNANSGKENYLLMLYHGYQNVPTVAPSNDMARMAGSVQIQNQLTVWTSGAAAIRSDIDFYGDSPSDPYAGLGVLRLLTVPGHLSEGSFHDYAPETHRLMNDDYCKLEALRMRDYFLQWFQKPAVENATISGWVKSGNEKVDVLNQPKFYYVPGSHDQWLPLNGALVELKNVDETLTFQTCTTDDWYNGIFAFYDVTPGTYHVVVSKQNYQTITREVTVAAAQIAQVKVQTDNVRMDVSDYENPEQDPGLTVLNDYEFLQNGTLRNAAEGVLRALFRKINGVENIYVLHDDNTIIKYNNNLGTTTSIEIPVPNNAAILDIAFSADNYLLGYAYNRTSNKIAVYTWERVDGTTQPTLLFEEDAPAGVSMKNSMAVSGARWNAKFYFAAHNGIAEAIVGVQYNEDEGGAAAPIARTYSNIPAETYTLTIMPSGEILVGQRDYAAAATFDWENNTSSVKLFNNPSEAHYFGGGAGFFRYAHHAFMTLPVGDADFANVGFVMYDIEAGLDNAVQVTTTQYPATGLGADEALYAVALSRSEDYDIYVYLMAEEEGYQMFKLYNKPVANIYASEVKLENNVFSFRLNEDATAVTLSIYNDQDVIATEELGALTKGAHSVNNPFTQNFNAYTITASARAVAMPVQVNNTNAEQFHYYAPRGVAVDRNPSSPFFGRIYVPTIAGGSDGASAVTKTQTGGVYILTADGEDIYNQGVNGFGADVNWGTNDLGTYSFSVGRPAVAPNGDVYICSSSKDAPNVWIMNPAEPTAEFRPVFQGNVNEENGQMRRGKNVITNMVQHAVILGEGANTKLYTYDRAMPAVVGNINRYDIGDGSNLPWQAAPSAIEYNDEANGNKMQNGCGQIAYDGHGGFWMAQYRYTSSAGIPALIHETNGVIDYNISNLITGCNRGAVAVNEDGSLLALATDPGQIKLYNVTYDANNAPTIEENCTVTWAASGYTTGIDFDAAGNLYIVSAGTERLHIFATPKLVNSYTTRISLGGAVEDLSPVTCNSSLVQKIIRNGQVYILKDGKMYTPLGILVD